MLFQHNEVSPISSWMGGTYSMLRFQDNKLSVWSPALASIITRSLLSGVFDMFGAYHRKILFLIFPVISMRIWLKNFYCYWGSKEMSEVSVSQCAPLYIAGVRLALLLVNIFFNFFLTFCHPFLLAKFIPSLSSVFSYILQH